MTMKAGVDETSWTQWQWKVKSMKLFRDELLWDTMKLLVDESFFAHK